jgi:hypothetical protein
MAEYIENPTKEIYTKIKLYEMILHELDKIKKEISSPK